MLDIWLPSTGTAVRRGVRPSWRLICRRETSSAAEEWAAWACRPAVAWRHSARARRRARPSPPAAPSPCPTSCRPSATCRSPRTRWRACARPSSSPATWTSWPDFYGSCHPPSCYAAKRPCSGPGLLWLFTGKYNEYQLKRIIRYITIYCTLSSVYHMNRVGYAQGRLALVEYLEKIT